MNLSAHSQSDIRRAEQFAALAHPARLEILRCLARHQFCKCKDVVDVLPLAQSTVSQHLKVLVEAGLVNAQLSRPASRYSLNTKAMAELGATTQDLIAACCAPRGCAKTKESAQVNA
ncbi:MAG: metalloregulator ArsR/SmtB family transcription factor [Pseudomonadota bacterium]